MNYASFVVGDMFYAIPTYTVQEFSRALPITYVHAVDDRIAGLINLRGQVATAIDLYRCLEDGEPPEDRVLRMITLEITKNLPAKEVSAGAMTCEDPAVLLVDRILGMLSVPDSEVVPPVPGSSQECVAGLIRHGDKLFSILEISKLLEEIGKERIDVKH